MSSGTLSRLAAFTTSPEGGNPAGVWVGETLPEPELMQRIAAEVGYSETAFVAPATGPERTVRYFSPEAEVSFCGHATIATGVLLGQTEGEGTYQLATAVGMVPVTVRRRDGQLVASLTSVEPVSEPAPSHWFTRRCRRWAGTARISTPPCRPPGPMPAPGIWCWPPLKRHACKT